MPGMTLRPLLSLRAPADFADWFRAGGEYTIRVARSLDIDTGGLSADVEAGVAAMRADETDVEPAVARVVAATLLGDAAFGHPFLQWTPRWYRAAMTLPIELADRRLSRVAAVYAERARRRDGTSGRVTDDTATEDDSQSNGSSPVDRPTFSTPSSVRVDGRPLSAHLSELGFAERFLLADAVLHVEWFCDVARACGLSVPESSFERTLTESASYYAGLRASLSPETRRIQRALFGDDAWVRDVNTTYRLNSTLLSVWEGILRRERRRLARVSESDSPLRR